MSDSDIRALERDYAESDTVENANSLLYAMLRQGRTTTLEARLAYRVVRLERAMWALLGRNNSVFAGVTEARYSIMNPDTSWEQDALSVLLAPDGDTLKYEAGMLGTDPLRHPELFGPPVSTEPTSPAEDLVSIGMINYNDIRPTGDPIRPPDPLPPFTRKYPRVDSCPCCGASPPCEQDCR